MKLGMNNARFVPDWERRLPAGVFRERKASTRRLEASAPSIGGSIFLSFLYATVPAIAQPANALPPLIPAYGEIPPTFWEQHGTLVLIGVFAFLVLAGLGLWKMFQPKLQPVLPPEAIARAALEKIKSQPEDGKVLSEVSQILRRYICAAFELPGNERPTAEFCAAISNHETIGVELAQTLASFLRECDVRKFSPANLAAPLNSASRALEIVSLAEKRREQTNSAAESSIK